MAVKRCCSTATISAVSSTERVVWVNMPTAMDARLECGRVLQGLDQRDRARGQLTERADDLRMVVVADEENLAAAPKTNLRLPVDLGDQRAGRIDAQEAGAAGFVEHRLGDAVGREHHLRPPGTSSSSSTNTAPLALSSRPRICCGRSRGGRRPAVRNGQSTLYGIDRAHHPGQKPRGEQSKTVKVGPQIVGR